MSETGLVDDHHLEIMVLVRLVHSETEKGLYQQLIDSAGDLKSSIGQELAV